MNNQHKEDQSRKILSTYFVPLLQNSELTGPHPDVARSENDCVIYDTRHRMRVYLPGGKQYYLFRRLMPYSQAELDFIRQVFGNLGQSWNRSDMATVERAVDRAVAGHICPDQDQPFLDIVGNYGQWASLSPGQPHTTGLYAKLSDPSGTPFLKLRDDPAVRSVASSSDTMLALGKDGEILKMERIPPLPADPRAVQQLYAPLGTANLALWASSRHKTALRLTKHGEILVFKSKKLDFVKKGNVWRVLPHTLVDSKALPERIVIVDHELQEAVYLTSMDLAFDKKDACIAILFEGKKTENGLSRYLPGFSLDLRNLPGSNCLFKAAVAERKFQDIPRAIRAELCALTGITVIEKDGTVAALGVGLQEGGTDERQGRLDAVHNLARKGVGISISEQGHIGLYKGDNPPLMFV